MENALYLAISRQQTLGTNMSVIANNVANANTNGYRGQNLLFHEFISDPRGGDDELSFVVDRGHYQTTTPGSVSLTGNQLDISLQGPGYIGIQDPNAGDTAFTRDGHFQINQDGTLVTSLGFPVADAGGASITIPQGSTAISIDERGIVSNQDGQLGQIQIVEFANLQALEARGNNLYTSEPGNVISPATETRVQQGSLEGSNVNAILEMTRMIETLREHQSLQRLTSSENDRLRTAIQQLTGQQ